MKPQVAARAASDCRRALIAKTCGLPLFSLFTCLATIHWSWESVPRDGGVVRLHVKVGYFFTPPKQVTLPTWGPPHPCKHALRNVMDWHHLHFEWQATKRKRRALLFFPRTLLWRATCAWLPSRLIYISVSLFDSNYKAAFFTLAFFKIPAVEESRNGKRIY